MGPTSYQTALPRDMYMCNPDGGGAGIRTLVDLRQQVLSLSPLAARAPPLKEREGIPKKSNYIKKMLRPGFEPESSARKAEMIGRTTPSEQKIRMQ